MPPLHSPPRDSSARQQGRGAVIYFCPTRRWLGANRFLESRWPRRLHVTAGRGRGSGGECGPFLAKAQRVIDLESAISSMTVATPSFSRPPLGDVASWGRHGSEAAVNVCVSSERWPHIRRGCRLVGIPCAVYTDPPGAPQALRYNRPRQPLRLQSAGPGARVFGDAGIGLGAANDAGGGGTIHVLCRGAGSTAHSRLCRPHFRPQRRLSHHQWERNVGGVAARQVPRILSPVAQLPLHL